MRYFFSTGEVSGEQSAIAIANAIRGRDPDAEFEGIGAGAMRDAGVTLWRDHTGWASMGPLAAIPRIPKLLWEMWRTAVHLARSKPDLVVLVDFGVFNVRLAMTLRERLHYDGPIMYLFPPGAWLDSERTAQAVSRWTIPVSAFAHQADLYRGLGLEIYYFGHPLVSLHEMRPARAAPPADGGCVALLPGSRSGEVAVHFPLLLRALEALQRLRPRATAVCGAADVALRSTLERVVVRSGVRDVQIVDGARAALASADAAWVASGTAVLESALLGVPVIALYVVPRSVVWYGKRMQRRIYGGRFITLPNLVMEREVVPEFLQEAATPERLARAMDELLDDPSSQYRPFASLRETLGDARALDRIAEFAVRLAAGSS